MEWYTLQCYGNELKIMENLKNIIEMNKMEDKVGEMIVPTIDIIEIKKGEKVIKEKSVYSGYIFIEAELTKEVQGLITSVPKISNFVNDGIAPVPLSAVDLENIKKRAQNRGEARPKFDYLEGEEVLILDGSFANFKGIVENYDLESGKLKIAVSIFGRKTPVEIDFEHVEKIEE